MRASSLWLFDKKWYIRYMSKSLSCVLSNLFFSSVSRTVSKEWKLSERKGDLAISEKSSFRIRDKCFTRAPGAALWRLSKGSFIIEKCLLFAAFRDEKKCWICWSCEYSVVFQRIPILIEDVICVVSVPPSPLHCALYHVLSDSGFSRVTGSMSCFPATNSELRNTGVHAYPIVFISRRCFLQEIFVTVKSKYMSSVRVYGGVSFSIS